MKSKLGRRIFQKYRDRKDARVVASSEFFQADWYLSRYPDVGMSGIDPALHYIRYGWKEGRNPSPHFSTSTYLSTNLDVANSGYNPLVHFIKAGQTEGRWPGVASLPRTEEKIALTFESAPVPSERIRPSYETCKNERVAVFASYSANGRIAPYVEHYLKHLARVARKVIFIADNDVPPEELSKIQPFVFHTICGRHGEYDFGSYKRGIEFASRAGLLDQAEELILCNDSCYGPVGGFETLFETMGARPSDFWGVTANTEFQYHLQSYFVVFKRPVFGHASFNRFFNSIKAQPDVSQVILSYEVPMTQYFLDRGFKSECLIDFRTEEAASAAKEAPNLTLRPQLLMTLGCPLIKVKAFKKAGCNLDGIDNLLTELRSGYPEIYAQVLDHASPLAFLKAPTVSFSIILPFHNRIETLPAAIDSALAQTHRNFELILVDDGSQDGSAELIQSRYKRELEDERIVLIKLADQSGVSAARNTGLHASRNRWIAYLDSDNQIRPTFLSNFADSIVEHPNSKLFYSKFMTHPDRVVRGRSFVRSDLLRANFIDLGVFVHSRSFFEQYGGFDTSLKRLIDWDLIIRYTTECRPVFIQAVLLDYCDVKEDASRISVKESIDDAKLQVRLKHGLPFQVTTVIPSYNHERYIAQAIESAIAQKGNFVHEIIVCDDGSTDNTSKIVSAFANKNKNLIRNLSSKTNYGISETFKRCIQSSSGDFIAILEGDDYWLDPQKIHKQVQFLLDNNDCTMVFSRLLVSDNGRNRMLQRQNNLPQKLTGQDFLNSSTLNLIANFSSCLFRAGLLRSAPDRLFQGRFNEIALAFHLERFGKIGFMNAVLSVYRQHSQGVWTGSDKWVQLEGAIATREMARDVAAPQYANEIEFVINAKKAELAAAIPNA